MKVKEFKQELLNSGNQYNLKGERLNQQPSPEFLAARDRYLQRKQADGSAPSPSPQSQLNQPPGDRENLPLPTSQSTSNSMCATSRSTGTLRQLPSEEVLRSNLLVRVWEQKERNRRQRQQEESQQERGIKSAEESARIFTECLPEPTGPESHGPNGTTSTTDSPQPPADALPSKPQNVSGEVDGFPSPLPKRIPIGVDKGGTSGYGRFPGITITPVGSMAPFADGSVVVEVVDPELNCSVYMRRFASGEMIPLDQDY
jgi:hypothetical protein